MYTLPSNELRKCNINCRTSSYQWYKVDLGTMAGINRISIYSDVCGIFEVNENELEYIRTYFLNENFNKLRARTSHLTTYFYCS